MSASIALLVSALIVALMALVFLSRSSGRKAVDVICDLENFRERSVCQQKATVASSHTHKAQAGLRYETLVPIALSLVALLFAHIFFPASPQALFSAAALGLLVGCVLGRRRANQAQARKTRQLEFYLPIVMERLVMAVHSGYDILSAMRVVLEHAKRQRGAAALDPVCLLIDDVLRLTEAGRSLEDSLNDVASKLSCPAVRHAFIHLALAHKEGGELVMPLRELSDATQLYYQETVEEDIARMPVRATLPLLCTFAGLILFFLVPPIMQVLDMTNQAIPKG